MQIVKHVFLTSYRRDDCTCLQLVPCRRLLTAPVPLSPVQLRAPVLIQSPLCRHPQAAAAANCSSVSAVLVQKPLKQFEDFRK